MGYLHRIARGADYFRFFFLICFLTRIFFSFRHEMDLKVLCLAIVVVVWSAKMAEAFPAQPALQNDADAEAGWGNPGAVDPARTTQPIPPECDGADDARSLIGCPIKQSQMEQN